MNKTWIVFLFALMGVKTAWAEGGTCPPGYYPVNSPGVMGCAPIPGYGGGDEPVDTGPSWMTTWGAIAADGERQIVASVHGQGSKRRAEAAAIKQCRARGGSKKCQSWISFYNQCGVMVAGDTQATTYRAGTVEEANREALKQCSALTSHCKVIQTACSYPVQVN